VEIIAPTKLLSRAVDDNVGAGAVEVAARC
jgi:hypothetical protein